jgi:hypothetical protein
MKLIFIVLLCIVGLAPSFGQTTSCAIPYAEQARFYPPSTYSAKFDVLSTSPGYFIPQWRKSGETWKTGDAFPKYDGYRGIYYIQTGLEAGQTYEIRFQQQCTGGQLSDFSSPLSFTTLATCPTPTRLWLSGDSFSWESIASVNHVVEWRKKEQSSWESSPVLNEGGQMGRSYVYQTPGLNEGIYECRVKAVCPEGLTSAYLNGSDGTVNPCIDYFLTDQPFVSPSATSARLYLSTYCSFSHYEIRWKARNAPYWNHDCMSDTAYVIGGASYAGSAFFQFTGLTQQTVYDYQIGRLRLGQEPLFAPLASFTTVSSVPTDLTTVSSGATGAWLRWRSSGYATPEGTYELQHRIQGTTAWTTTTLNSLTLTEHTLTGLAMNTSHEWRVRLSTNPEGVFSPISMFTTACPEPGAPIIRGFSMVGYCSTMLVFWNGCKNTGTRYELRYRLAGTSSWTVTDAPGESTSYEVSDAAPGAAYEAQVLAYCPGSVSVIVGPVGSGTVICSSSSCKPPTNTTQAKITAQSVTLRWQGIGPNEFRWRRANTTTWNSVIVPYPIQEYTLRGLNDQTTYEWQVRALCNDPNAFTPVMVFRTVCNLPFSTYTKCVTSSSALLTWQNAGGRTSYTIDWRAVGSTDWTSVSGLTGFSYALMGLLANTPYEWRIRTECGTVASSGNGPTISFHTNVCSDQLHTVKAGLWNDPATWSCGRVPLAEDVVIVAHVVTAATNTISKARKIQFQPGGKVLYGSRGRVQMRF